MKKSIIVIFCSLIVSIVNAQGISENLFLDSFKNETPILATKSITLKSGFHIPEGQNALIRISQFPSLKSQPSIVKNFIRIKTFRISGVTQSSLNLSRTAGEENQAIQYFDGLGRTIQRVYVMGSPEYRDIVQHIEYDRSGRESKKYLPYMSYIEQGSYRLKGADSVLRFYSEHPLIANGTSKPYATTIFENSSLNRSLEQGSPGETWQPLSVFGTGRTVKKIYGTNVSSGAEAVKLWSIDANGASSITNYSAGKLYVVTIRDENNINQSKTGSTEEFRDLGNRIILKRSWKSETENLDTYYIYNDLGDLCFVVPPAVKVNTFTSTPSDLYFDKYIYAYRYDDKARLVQKKIPGKGWEYLIYNKSDQIVLTQDSLQRGRKEWTFNRYDSFGRITSTGVYTNTLKITMTEVQELVNGSSGPLWERRIGNDYPSPATTFPVPGDGITIKPLIVNYYDDYNFNGADVLPELEIIKSAKVRSLKTGSKVYRIDGTSPLLTVMYYDDKGRLIQSAAQNHLEGKDYITNTYNFPGELLVSKRIHIPKTGNTTILVSTNLYDHVGRPISVKEKIGTQDEVVLLANKYNEIGQLTTRLTGKTDKEPGFVDTTTFTYNERGWMKRIASNNFTQSLFYNDGGIVPQYNGNVSQIMWRSTPAGITSTFNYSYDKLNRLVNGTSSPSGIGSMTEVVSYDDMGNIITLKRDALAVTNYTYEGNKLIGLSGGISGSLTYDGNGNIKTDRKGTAFTYNYLNLPQTANNDGLNVGYVYSASGVKLQKTTKIGTTNQIITVRDYLNGIEYNNGSIDNIQNAVGYALKSGANYVYHYNLTDHLGNIRATLKRGSTDTTINVIQRDNYYAFGKRMILAGGNNKYLYNGKEIQSELGDQYDYGARFYDAELGRWNMIDPLAETYINWSPYSYAMNNPLRMIDPNGMEVIPVKGGYTYTKEDAQDAFHLVWNSLENKSKGRNGSIGIITFGKEKVWGEAMKFAVPEAIMANVPAGSGQGGYDDFYNALEEISKQSPDGIGFLAVFSHGGVDNNPTRATYGEGMIFANADIHPDANNVYTSDLSRLGTAVDAGKVKFASYSTVYLGACNAATVYKSKNFPDGQSFALELAKATRKAFVWAAANEHMNAVNPNNPRNTKFYPEEGGVLTINYWPWFSPVGQTVKPHQTIVDVVDLSSIYRK